MNGEKEQATESTTAGSVLSATALQRRHELEHLRHSAQWFLLLGALLVACGLVAIIFPVITSLAALGVLSVILLITGVITIVGAFWAGRWSGFLIQLLVGILYLGCAMIITDRPGLSIQLMTLFLAVFFVVLGVFRSLGAPVPPFSPVGLGAAQRRRHPPLRPGNLPEFARGFHCG